MLTWISRKISKKDSNSINKNWKKDSNNCLWLHKQQIEFQQFTLQKTELQQKQLEELLENSLNGSKNSDKDTIFSQGTIYNSIETFEYIPENDKSLEAFYRRYEDIFNVDSEQWPSEKRVLLLLR